MAPRTQSRSRAKPARPAARRPARRPTNRRRAQPSHQPLLTSDQRRELSGVSLVGLGLLLAVVLALPQGGSLAKPVHDAALGGLGIGAWLGAAALPLIGPRLLGRRQWAGGGLAAAGSVLVVVAALVIFDRVLPGSAGVVGQHLGSGLARWLGGAGAVALMLVVICGGLVLAVDLRIAPGASSLRQWLGTRSEPKPARTPRQPAHDRAVSLTGVPAEFPFPPAPAQLSLSDAGYPAPLDDLAAAIPAEPLPEFGREFEGTVEPPALGAIPEVAVLHGEALGEEEPEKVWTLPDPEMLDTVTGKRERLEKEVQATGALIVSTLASFAIQARIVGANSGPTVTQYELQPAAGVPVRKIVAAQTDLSLALAAPVRIQPFIPGKSAVGIEVPNKAAQLVSLKSVVSAPAFSDTRKRLAVA